MIEEGLVMMLEHAGRAGNVKPARIPISKATGGLRPSVALTDSAALLKLMETD
jgi:hypothetical protein